MLSPESILGIIAGGFTVIALILILVASIVSTDEGNKSKPIKTTGHSKPIKTTGYSKKDPGKSQSNDPMLPNDKLTGADWSLSKDFWSGLTESNWLTTLRSQGWAILNVSEAFKNNQKDWSSEHNVSWNSSDGLVIKLSEATSDCCCTSTDPTGENPTCGSCAGQTTCAGQVESPQWFSPGDYIEIVAKVPKAEGVWPAIWLLGQDSSGWPSEGEIDIMEHGGWTNAGGSPGFKWDEDAFFSTVHCCCCDDQSGCSSGGCNCSGANGKRIAYGNKVADGLENWNTYGCYWSKDSNIVWMFLNGKFLGCETNCDVSQINGKPCIQAWGDPMRAIFNIAIGGDLGTDTGKSNWNPDWAKEFLKIRSGRIWKNNGTED